MLSADIVIDMEAGDREEGMTGGNAIQQRRMNLNLNSHLCGDSAYGQRISSMAVIFY